MARGRFDVESGLRALAHPRRRQLVSLVLNGEETSGRLAERCRLSRPATSQHLKVLRDAGLVTSRVEGNRRFYRACPERLVAVRALLDDFWGTRLNRLAQELQAGESGS